MIKALLVPTDGIAKIVEVQGGLESIRQAIGGGWIEAVSDSVLSDWHAYIDEEGKLKGMYSNIWATALANSLGWPPGDVLCGPAIFLGEHVTMEGVEEADVPERVIREARRIGILGNTL